MLKVVSKGLPKKRGVRSIIEGLFENENKIQIKIFRIKKIFFFFWMKTIVAKQITMA